MDEIIGLQSSLEESTTQVDVIFLSGFEVHNLTRAQKCEWWSQEQEVKNLASWEVNIVRISTRVLGNKQPDYPASASLEKNWRSPQTKEAVIASAISSFCFPYFCKVAFKCTESSFPTFILICETCPEIFWAQRPAGIKQPMFIQVLQFLKWGWQSCLLRMFPGTSQVLNHAQVLSGRVLVGLSPKHVRDHSHSSVE